MRIAIVSDAWHPQINGVVTTLCSTRDALQGLGHQVALFTPDLFRTWPCPGYPDVGMAYLCGPKLRPMLKAFRPDALHLASESSIGFAARRFCREFDIPYTTAYHSHFPEYFRLRAGVPLWVTYTYMRWFHWRSQRIMVSTPSLQAHLAAKGFSRLALWSRGVDTDLFRPRDKAHIQDQRPVFMYVGRVAVEKDVEAFLALDLPGSRYVVGDGPQRLALQQQYPQARFLGYQTGAALAQLLAAADVLVFPSRHDTYGLVLLEALACGVPVAALPVPGPSDVVKDPRVGVLHPDLREAALAALALDPQHCREYAERYSWRHAAEQFVANLAPLPDGIWDRV